MAFPFGKKQLSGEINPDVMIEKKLSQLQDVKLGLPKDNSSRSISTYCVDAILDAECHNNDNIH